MPKRKVKKNKKTKVAVEAKISLGKILFLTLLLGVLTALTIFSPRLLDSFAGKEISLGGKSFSLPARYSGQLVYLSQGKLKLFDFSGSRETELATEDERLKKTRLGTAGRFSPDGQFYLEYDPEVGFEKLVSVSDQEEFWLRPWVYYASLEKAKWSPDGEKIAFLYQVDNPYSANYSLGLVLLEEVLNQQFVFKKQVFPQAERLDFDWIDNQLLLVGQFYHDSRGSVYRGEIGIYDLEKGEFKPLISSLETQLLFQTMVILSPQKDLLAYQLAEKITETEIIVADLTGREVKRISGSNPLWLSD